jgi:hypothetical protein
MNDFIIYGNSFDACIENLTLILKRCMKINLVLNYKKCHFMVEQGIVLGHIVFSRGLEVNKAKIDIIFSLSYPVSIREVYSFL